MPEEHDLTLAMIDDGSRPEDTQDFAQQLTMELNRERGLRAEVAELPPRQDGAGAKGVEHQLGTLAINILTDPKVIAAFVGLLGGFLHRRPSFQFEIRRKDKKLRITASDFKQGEIKQIGKMVETFLEK